MAAERQAVLKLYKNILRESEKFSSYNVREYAIRRVKDAFRERTAKNDLESALNEGKSSLELIKRQALISNLYSTEKLVIETKK